MRLADAAAQDAERFAQRASRLLLILFGPQQPDGVIAGAAMRRRAGEVQEQREIAGPQQIVVCIGTVDPHLERAQRAQRNHGHSSRMRCRAVSARAGYCGSPSLTRRYTWSSGLTGSRGL